MKTVKVTEANQQFSKLIKEVEESGVSIRIVRRGDPIAILSPDTEDEGQARKRADVVKEMRRLLKKGIQLGNEPFDRDALHDRN